MPCITALCGYLDTDDATSTTAPGVTFDRDLFMVIQGRIFRWFANSRLDGVILQRGRFAEICIMPIGGRMKCLVIVLLPMTLTFALADLDLVNPLDLSSADGTRDYESQRIAVIRG